MTAIKDMVIIDCIQEYLKEFLDRFLYESIEDVRPIIKVEIDRFLKELQMNREFYDYRLFDTESGIRVIIRPGITTRSVVIDFDLVHLKVSVETLVEAVSIIVENNSVVLIKEEKKNEI